MRQFGLIGYPLGHSFSATYFSEKFSREKIEAEYRNYPLKDIEEFNKLAAELTDLEGLNVTVPFKEKIIPLLDSLSPRAEAIKAVNTVSFIRTGSELHLRGDNTDVIGFRRSLEKHLRSHHTSALVLGTGGSSKAVLYVLQELGINCKSVSRKAGPDRISYDELDPALVKSTLLLINTTPLGMYPKTDAYPAIPYQALTAGHLLFDLVYNPAKTKFLALGEDAGAQTVNGYEMLIYQAEASWQIWNGFDSEAILQ